MRIDGQWELQPRAINKNWSWRPYFLQTIIKMRNDQSGEISELYRDIETGKLQEHFLLLLTSMSICSSIFRMITYTNIIYLDSSMNKGYKKIACTHNFVAMISVIAKNEYLTSYADGLK